MFTAITHLVITYSSTALAISIPSSVFFYNIQKFSKCFSFEILVHFVDLLYASSSSFIVSHFLIINIVLFENSLETY